MLWISGESTPLYEPVWGISSRRLPVTAFFRLATFLLSYATVSHPARGGQALRHNSPSDSL